MVQRDGQWAGTMELIEGGGQQWRSGVKTVRQRQSGRPAWTQGRGKIGGATEFSGVRSRGRMRGEGKGGGCGDDGAPFLGDATGVGDGLRAVRRGGVGLAW
jgi:hypothetical protein